MACCVNPLASLTATRAVSAFLRLATFTSVIGFNDSRQYNARMISFPCPKCGRTLEQSGEVVVHNVTLPIFQCDECIVVTDFMGEPFELALTFAVGQDGKPFDPASPTGELLI